MGLMLGSTQINSMEVFKRGSSKQDVWTPPEDWPNIRKMLENDNGHGYEYVAYALFASDYYPNVIFNYPYWRTSDGHEYRGNATHVWDDPNAKYGWIAMYSNSPFTYIQAENNFGRSKRLLWICFNFDITNCNVGTAFKLQSLECPNSMKYTGTSGVRALQTAISLKNIPKEIDLSECTNCSQMFQNCYELKTLPEDFDISNSTTTANMFANCYSLVKVPNTLDISKSTDSSSMFNACYSLKSAPKELDMLQVKNAVSMFYGCFQLESLPDEIIMPVCTNCSQMFLGCQTTPRLPRRLILDVCTNCSSMFANCFMAQVGPDEIHIPRCTNCQQMFNSCINMRNLPDTLDIGSSTNNNMIFGYCTSLENVPTHLTANASVSFQWSDLVSRDSIATFDSNGNINGGMVYNLNTCSASGQTITFHNTTKTKFTSDEWTKIKTMLSSKNWGCSPA